MSPSVAKDASRSDEHERYYHFEVPHDRPVDPEKIRCLCHDVAVAAAARQKGASAPGVPEDKFCIFRHTIMRDILAAKHAASSFWTETHWCNCSDGVMDAVRQMTESDVGALLVMNRARLDIDQNDVISEDELRAAPETGAIMGIITERDYLRAAAHGLVSAETKVRDIMTSFDDGPRTKLVSVEPDTSVLAAMELMSMHRIRHIPCISSASGSVGAKMEGMVSINDVVKALMAEDREEVQLMEDYVHGMYD